MFSAKVFKFSALLILISVCLGFSAAFACPICGSDSKCDLAVKNYNTRLDRVTGQKDLNVIRLTMEEKETPEMHQILEPISKACDFLKTTSRGKFQLKINKAENLEIPKGGCLRSGPQRKKVGQFRKNLPPAFITICQWPLNVCGYSNAGGGVVWMKHPKYRTFVHEIGHLLGLRHSKRLQDQDTNKAKILLLDLSDGRKTGFVEYGDATSFMGGSGSPQSYAIAQLHWLGWTEPREIIRINDCLQKNKSIEVTLRPVGNNAKSNSNTPLAYVYEIPDSPQQLWISIPKDNGEIYVHQAHNRKGFKHHGSGMLKETIQMASIKNPKTPGPRKCAGLIIEPIECKTKPDDKNKISQVKIKISLPEDATPIQHKIAKSDKD